MRNELRIGATCMAFALLLVSCAGSPEPVSVEPEEPERREEQPQQAEADAETDSGSQESEESTPGTSDESENEKQQPQSEPAEEPIEVSDAVYEETFSEIEAVIEELNTIIAERDVEKWKGYLTEEYVAEYSDKERLAEISERPILAQNDITLESIDDYFNKVVVPSRRNARLDDLRFLDEEEVQAIMKVNNTSVILYRLKKVDGRWKVDVG